MISGILVGEYGFSTKPLIDDLDWYYYGFRYYDAVTGRWPSRDPIGEKGGVNLYQFIRNMPINWIEYLGLNPFTNYDPFNPDPPSNPFTPDPPSNPFNVNPPILTPDPFEEPPGAPPFGPDNPFSPDPNDPPVAWSGEYRCSVTSSTSADSKECIPYSCNLINALSGNPPTAASTSPNAWEIDMCQSCPNNVTFTLNQGLTTTPLVPVPSL
jgi:RHS repeat-associated protein